MRKSLFFILLATAAMPALAAVQTEDRGGDRRAERADRSERANSSETAQRTERAARSERAEQTQTSVAVERVDRTERVRAPRADDAQNVQGSKNFVRSSNRRSANDYSGRRNRTEGQPDGGVAPAPAVTPDSRDSVTNWRARERRAARANSPNVPTPTTTSGDTGTASSGTNWGVRTPDGGTSTAATRSGNWRDGHRHRWSSEWRRDGRYNWRHHRSRYSSLFRLGRYYDPFGYGYRRFSIGFNLWPSYYGNNFWLNDPWQYRLPPAYGPYRWIRYYDDALLVNIYDGQVVDVIRNFFW